MRKTLREVIRRDDHCVEVERAIRIAYCAGESAMRGAITEGLRRQYETLPTTRYTGVVNKVLKHLLDGVMEINTGYVYHGSGDSGSEEAAELLSCDYELPIPSDTERQRILDLLEEDA